MNDSLWAVKKWWRDRFKGFSNPQTTLAFVTNLAVVVVILLGLLTVGINVLDFVLFNIAPVWWSL
jgi:hypothetical protein